MDADEALEVILQLAGGPVREPDPEALDELYRSLPRVRCLGECWSSCSGDIQMSPLERDRIQQRGVRMVPGGLVPIQGGKMAATACSALDQTKLVCRVYEDRPMICRLWGIFESLACPWGCKPEGGYIDDVEAMRLLNLALWYGGSGLAVEPDKWDRMATHPQYRQALKEHLARGKPTREQGVIIQGTIRKRPGL